MNFRLTCAMALLACIAGSTGARAAELPQIKVTDDNAVMSCATPGRLMAYLKANNPNIQDKFEEIGTDYMRHGEALGIRWDYAFFQMLVETGYLKFTGDVDVKQNNFAGLGATGKGAKGESFPDVSTGVKAHLQHILMYTGAPMQDAVAQRTRDVQAWGVLTKWQASIKRPMTFKDLTSKWAPTSKAYPRDILSVAERFEKGLCQQDDPQPELVAEARGGSEQPAAPKKTKSKVVASKEAPKTAGATVAAIAEDEATEKAAPKSVDGAKEKAAAAADAAGSAGNRQGVKVLNQGTDTADEAPVSAVTAESVPPADSPPVKDSKATKADAKKPAAEKPFETAAMTGAGATAAGAAPVAKCKVWQASYGGSKAIIIKAQAEKLTNYTVLDVNDGAEKREADAYIAAYAKGGSTVGEFATPAQALEKAFQLCPEG